MKVEVPKWNIEQTRIIYKIQKKIQKNDFSFIGEGAKSHWCFSIERYPRLDFFIPIHVIHYVPFPHVHFTVSNLFIFLFKLFTRLVQKIKLFTRNLNTVFRIQAKSIVFLQVCIIVFLMLFHTRIAECTAEQWFWLIYFQLFFNIEIACDKWSCCYSLFQSLLLE